MSAKHTPGPWIFYADLPSTEPNWHIVTTANKMRVLANVHIEPGNAMDVANARLIAAAPELLEALRMAEKALNSVHETDGLLDHEIGALTAVRSAIAKADTALAECAKPLSEGVAA